MNDECIRCHLFKPDLEEGFCSACIDEMKEEDLAAGEAQPEEAPEVVNPIPREEAEPVEPQESTVEKATKVAAQVERTAAAARATVARVAWTAKSAVAVLANPVTWISIVVVIALFVIGNVASTTYRTVGSIAADGENGGAGTGSDLLARLAQRGLLLSMESKNFNNVNQFASAHNGDPGRLNGNPWAQACPDIVNMIYGMPDLYVGNNGNVNAYRNYQRLVASGAQAQAWWFPETSSPGAAKQKPPAGAIVSTLSSSPYGHTYVVLTDDYKVIDNTWNINKQGTTTSPQRFRTLDEGYRNRILGWFVPPAEGYEGTFLNDDPMLPPAPEWAQGSGGAGGSGGGSTTPTGEPQEIAKKMVQQRNWGDAEFTCVVKLWTRESSWNPRAENPSSGAYGIPQALPGSKMASAGADWKTNPATQIKWGLDYMKDRYGTPCAAWAHSERKNWY
jgi:hypothetical protein